MGYKCHICGGSMTGDERALNLKLINRSLADDDLFCLPCLAEKFKLTEDDLRGMILRFRRSGCTLFTPVSPEEYKNTENKQN